MGSGLLPGFSRLGGWRPTLPRRQRLERRSEGGSQGRAVASVCPRTSHFVIGASGLSVVPSPWADVKCGLHGQC